MTGTPSQSYWVFFAIKDHNLTVLPATEHKWTHPTLIPAIHIYLYPGEMEAIVDLSFVHTGDYNRRSRRQSRL